MYEVAVDLEFYSYSHFRIQCEYHIAQEISDHFTFYVKNYKHMPKYKNGLWDGKIRLMDVPKRLLYTGLLPRLIKYCKENDITIRFDDQMKLLLPDNDIQSKKITDSYNPPFVPYDHQYSSIDIMLSKKRCLILSPTSSGKSFNIYVTSRYIKESEGNVLILVPTTSLVEQIAKDFDDYGWDSNLQCHKIYSGKDKVTNKLVTISTWQSIYKLPESYFAKYNAILVDECHLASAVSIKSIMEKCINCEYRIGLTGTLDESKTNEITLTGLFGEIFNPTTTKELMDAGIVSKLKINIVMLNHSDEQKKVVSSVKYLEEVKHIVQDKARSKFIAKLASSQTGNTMLLFRFKDHGKELFDLVKELSDSEHIYYIDGDISTEYREAVRAKVEEVEDAIVVASFGTFSTGINIKNLWNVIFAYPYKSKVKNLQSIGRTLRKMVDRDGAKLWDIVDDYTWKTKINTTLKHAIERIKTYIKEEFDYKIIKVNI